MAIMSADDEARVKSISEQWKQRQAAGASQSELSDIHHSAEAIRAQYGFSGGVDGTGYSPVSVPQPLAIGTPAAQTTAGNQNYINQLYQTQQSQLMANLDKKYRDGVATLDANAAKIPETYNTARNQTAAASEQNRTAFNEYAAARGLNSGTGGQAALAIGNTLTNNLSALDKGQARALTDIDTQRAKLKSDYDFSIASAIASNDLEKAKALYDEQVRSENLAREQLASQKSEFANTIGAYYDNYQLEIDSVQNNGDPSDDWKIPYLKQARNEKIEAQRQEALKAAKGSGSGSGSGGSKGATLTYPQLNSALKTMKESDESTPQDMYNFVMQNGGQYADNLLTIYGLSSYAPQAPSPRTVNYGNDLIGGVNERINAGYTPQEILAAAKQQYGANSPQYLSVASALLRQR